MRIVLSADMEGISQIRDLDELLAWRPQYWETGRARMTDDVVAAATGLLQGGATEVVVLDNHFSGNPCNVIADRLPAGARIATWNVFDLPALAVDGMLQVGYHPRRNVAGFAPHTYVPGLRLSIGDEDIGESHGRAWAANTRLLGIIGHAAHGDTLGSLAGTPFLAVQDGSEPEAATPRFTDPDASADAIRDFAREAICGIARAPRPAPPTQASFAASLAEPDDMQVQMMLAGGWTRTHATSFRARLTRWSSAREPLAAAMNAAMAPFAAELGALARLTSLFRARLH